jgi:hypothetical protein
MLVILEVISISRYNFSAETRIFRYIYSNDARTRVAYCYLRRHKSTLVEYNNIATGAKIECDLLVLGKQNLWQAAACHRLLCHRVPSRAEARLLSPSTDHQQAAACQWFLPKRHQRPPS